MQVNVSQIVRKDLFQYNGTPQENRLATVRVVSGRLMTQPLQLQF